jgi:hypothetical protein
MSALFYKILAQKFSFTIKEIFSTLGLTFPSCPAVTKAAEFDGYA